jgi:hypothetical protein
MLYNVHFGIYVDVAMPVEDKSKSLLPFLSSPKLLPNESEAEFESGLQSLLSELDNPSPLAVALISHLNECLWWMILFTDSIKRLDIFKGVSTP